MLRAPRDPHEVLELPPGATVDDAKKAYRRLALRWHPDRNPDDPTAGERFKEVAAAWQAFQEGGGGPSSHVDPFLEEVSEAVLRAQAWIERGVLPRYLGPLGRDYRTILDELDELAVPGAVPEGWLGWLARRRVARLSSRIELTTSNWPSEHATALFRLRGGRWEIMVLPDAFARAGLSGAALDDVVLRLLLVRYVQVLAGGVLPRARAGWTWPRRDWVLLALVVVAMLLAGFYGV